MSKRFKVQNFGKIFSLNQNQIINLKFKQI